MECTWEFARQHLNCFFNNNIVYGTYDPNFNHFLSYPETCPEGIPVGKPGT